MQDIQYSTLSLGRTEMHGHLKWPPFTRSCKAHKWRQPLCVSQPAAILLLRRWSSICYIFTSQYVCQLWPLWQPKTLRTGLRLTTLFRFVYFLNDDMCEALNPFLHDSSNISRPRKMHYFFSTVEGPRRTQWQTDFLPRLYNNLCDCDFFTEYILINAYCFSLFTDFHEECIERIVLGIASSCILWWRHNYSAENLAIDMLAGTPSQQQRKHNFTLEWWKQRHNNYRRTSNLP